MKLLSIAIPCYNSEAYMENCIKSLLPGGDEVEILVIDDGSKDRTAEIADEYQEKYPGIVRAIHQPNLGHGGAVNTGIHNAQGLYFKAVDLLISNFVYEKQGAARKKVMQYRHCLPVNQIFTWNEVGHMPKGKYLLMHSMIYRTQLLLECNLTLPEHTFYVDNIFAFDPLPYVQNMYYLDTNFYRYFIGRDDQSVNETVMIRRIDQQLRVNKLMVNSYTSCGSMNKRTRAYMISYLDIITTISSIMLIRSGTEENLEKKRELWKYIKDHDIRLFHHLRNGIMGNAMNLPGRGGRKISVAAYKLSQKIVGFN